MTATAASYGPPERAFAVRDERRTDAAAREALLDAAMGPGRRRKSSEALRRGRVPAHGLALVAVGDDGLLCGTVRLWHVHAGTRPDGSAVEALLLGPLAARADLKGEGIGKALMTEALARAAVSGHGAVLLVGDPEYYGRFGFSSGPTAGLAMPGPYETRRFLALELVPDWLRGAQGVLSPSGKERRAPASGPMSEGSGFLLKAAS